MSEATSDYGRGIDAEQALKYAIQHVAGERAEIVEGVITPVSPTWSHESAADEIREQIYAKVRELNCRIGSGDLDLPGSANWYIPDLAVVPRDVAKSADSLLPDQTLLVVEVTSPSNAETDRVVKRRRYAEYRRPPVPPGRPSGTQHDTVLGTGPARLHARRGPPPLRYASSPPGSLRPRAGDRRAVRGGPVARTTEPPAPP
ncbi:Putative restriction endonuclease [Streptomyces sp. SolWspMP-sol7th]|nr:Putative restriction endonuclease [Streptomyces sp. SolWspMP-sol7th]